MSELEVKYIGYVFDFKLRRSCMRSTSHDRYDRKVALYNTDILSVYFFRARPRHVADSYTENFTEMLAHAHAKGTRPSPRPGYEATRYPTVYISLGRLPLATTLELMFLFVLLQEPSSF